MKKSSKIILICFACLIFAFLLLALFSPALALNLAAWAGLLTVGLLYPLGTSVWHSYLLFSKKEWKPSHLIWIRLNQIITLGLGTYLTYLFSTVAMEIRNIDWQEAAINSELHLPIWSETHPTFIFFLLLGFLAYLVLTYTPLRKRPPLVTVLSMAAIYVTSAICLVWIVQILGVQADKGISPLFLCILPLNYILIAIWTIADNIRQWQVEPMEPRAYQMPILNTFSQVLYQAKHWSWLAGLALLPLLGICLMGLVLFGQRPDALITMWTETSDWTLSQKIAPPDLHIDQHYLCTVAARGHRGLVKPIRMGERHGHRIVVNRQLLIANAFEQVLEERLPKLHTFIRRYYDKYGFPLAKFIQKPWQSDLTYLLMKPAEWLFLAVIYLVDAQPENRIALQYFPKYARQKNLGNN